MYKSIVSRGDQIGRTIGFPTINLDPAILPQTMERGVYAAKVVAEDITRTGILYFGPRLVLKEMKEVLEIHILNFDQQIYGTEIQFEVGRYIRGVMNFPNLTSLKSQIDKDIQAVNKT